MAFDKNAFITELTSNATLDEAQKQALIAAFDNPVVAKNAEGLALRQSDYSRLSGELQKSIKAAQDNYTDVKKWKEDEDKRLQDERLAIQKKLTDEGISLDGFQVEHQSQKDVVSREELNRLAEDSVNYFKTLSTIQMRHLKEFGDILDVDKLHEVVMQDKVNLSIAYDRLVQPKREEVQKAAFAEQLKKAREEGAQEALKNVSIPAAEQPFSSGIPHSLDTLEKKQGVPEYGALVAAKAFMADKKAGKVAVW